MYTLEDTPSVLYGLNLRGRALTLIINILILKAGDDVKRQYGAWDRLHIRACRQVVLVLCTIFAQRGEENMIQDRFIASCKASHCLVGIF